MCLCAESEHRVSDIFQLLKLEHSFQLAIELKSDCALALMMTVHMGKYYPVYGLRQSPLLFSLLTWTLLAHFSKVLLGSITDCSVVCDLRFAKGFGSMLAC